MINMQAFIVVMHQALAASRAEQTARANAKAAAEQEADPDGNVIDGEFTDVTDMKLLSHE